MGHQTRRPRGGGGYRCRDGRAGKSATPNGGRRARATSRHVYVYIHTMEMSPFPERAWYAANGLRDLVPDAGHLQHMPSHIDILCGHYYDAVVANNKAIVADRKYLEREGQLNYYTIYRSHNYHFKLYAAMFLGQYKTAMDTVNEMIATIPEALLRVEEPPMADWLESFIGMKMDVLIRFGKWQEIINEPLPDDPTLYCVTTTMIHYAKGIAHAALGNVEAAEEEKQRFLDAFATVPETRTVYNNKCRDILAVAAEMLNGEIEYRKGNYEKAMNTRAPISLPGRQPALFRTLGLDATHPTRPWCALTRTRSCRRSRTSLSR